MNFAALDFETAQYSRESACSIGVVKYLNSEAVDSFYSLIRPPVLYIRPDFTDLHGITVDDVKDAPAFADIWESAVKPFIGDLPLAAHNAQFDMGVLWSVLAYYGIAAPPLPYFCTLALSRRAWPELRSHALTALAETFGIIYDAHNALEDARACGKLVQLSAERFGSEGLAELLKAADVAMKRLK
jgi:DNA polymerase-3 subunit epsilon